MIIIFDKKTNEIIGSASRINDNGVLRECTVKELFPNRSAKELGSIVVDDNSPASTFPGAYQLKLANGSPVGIEPRTRGIALTSSILDQDSAGNPIVFIQAQGPQIIGLGFQACEIFVQMMDGKDKLEDTAEVQLSTTSGILSSRFITTGKNGYGYTTFLFDNATTTVTITAKSEGMPNAFLTVEVYAEEDRSRFGGKTFYRTNT